MIKNISIENRWIGFLLIVYFFGLLGMAIPDFRGFFLPFTPVNLLLTLVVFYKVNKDFSSSFLVLSVLIFLIGFSIEAIGVATGALFGTYWYGDPFGFKMFDTPVMIGANWLFLSLSSYGIVQYFTRKQFFLITIPALLMTGLDILVEPIAIKLNFWNWENDVVPFQNYLMWFLVSLVIHSLIYFFSPKINSRISFVIFGVQIVFFGILNIVLS